MAKVSKNRKLGLSFGGEDLLLVETEEAAKNYKVTSLLNVSSDIPFSIDMFSQESGAEMVGSELKSVLAENGITTKSLAVSLELGIGSVIKIPYSKKLSDKDLSSHLNWELQQYIDEEVSGFTFDSYKLVKSPSIKNPELLLVGTRNNVISFFQEMSSHAEVDLHMVNVDVLSAVNTFETNYKFHPKEKIALVEIGERKLVFTLLEGNFFIGYHQLFLDDSTRNDFTNSVSELISMNLKTLFDDYELVAENNAFDHVFLYRSNTKYDLTELISASQTELKLFNPFEKIRLDSSIQDSIDFDSDNSEYVEALGLTIG